MNDGREQMHQENSNALADEPLAAHLNGILSSSAFQNSATLKNLLRFLFVNRKAAISEYAIAVEVFGRQPNFDPQVDATVRVQISRLRRRLKDFYLAEGSSTEYRFSIPIGTHQLVIESSGQNRLSAPLADPGSSPKALSDVQPQAARGPGDIHRIANLILACLVLVLSGICVSQFRKIHVEPQTGGPSTSVPLLPFWHEFLANGRATQIVIPNPAFFSLHDPAGKYLVVRDKEVNSYGEIDKSSELLKLQREFGPMHLTQEYTVSSDMVASLDLMHYLEMKNVPININISSEASAQSFEGENIILVGTPGTLSPFHDDLQHLYFEFDAQARHFLNPHPRGTELANFKVMYESSSTGITPGLIAFIPGKSPNSYELIVAGIQTRALVGFLTSIAGSQELAIARSHLKGSPFFEALILSETHGDKVLSNHLAVIREFNPQEATK